MGDREGVNKSQNSVDVVYGCHAPSASGVTSRPPSPSRSPQNPFRDAKDSANGKRSGAILQPTQNAPIDVYIEMELQGCLSGCTLNFVDIKLEVAF